MGRLTLEQISQEHRSHELSSINSITLTYRALSDVSCLGTLQSLEKLDISCNCLLNLEGLSSCINLKWLSVAGNKLESLKGIQSLSKLTVLNAGKNKLWKMDEISSVTNLRAVILNDNNISSICKLDQLKYLNTLVLSRNPISDIGDSLKNVKSITKLSLSHCEIETIGSSLMSCVDLKEARFSHNKITIIPAELAHNIRIQNLDLGNNLIENLSDLKVLSALHNLKNLNLQGNPFMQKDKLVNKVRISVPSLQIFNNKPIGGCDTRKNISGNDTLIHNKDDTLTHDESDIGRERKMKTKKPRKDVEVHVEDIKAEKLNKRKISEKSADVPLKSIPTEKRVDKHTHDENNMRSAKKKSRKEPESVEEKHPFGGIDDVETPFVDLILSDKALEASGVKKADKELVPDAKSFTGLVVDHTRKKKSAKAIVTGRLALELLSPIPEIGMGGPSTWDD